MTSERRLRRRTGCRSQGVSATSRTLTGSIGMQISAHAHCPTAAIRVKATQRASGGDGRRSADVTSDTAICLRRGGAPTCRPHCRAHMDAAGRTDPGRPHFQPRPAGDRRVRAVARRLSRRRCGRTGTQEKSRGNVAAKFTVTLPGFARLPRSSSKTDTFGVHCFATRHGVVQQAYVMRTRMARDTVRVSAMNHKIEALDWSSAAIGASSGACLVTVIFP